MFVMVISNLLDEAYEQLHDKGPEFEGWLANHGPMAADALVRLGSGDDVPGWVRGYTKRLEPMPDARWPITEAEWREPLGDASRLGDWCALLTQQVHAEPWDAVLARWWPRLLPGAVASAAHGLIRTGHAVRALREEVTAPRLDELGHALGYWAARWQPVPGPQPSRGTADVGAALEALPARELTGGIRTRLACLSDDVTWPRALAAMAPVADAVAVPRALDALVDAAVSHYRRWAHGNPIMLVHAATAPRAVALVLPALPEQLWPASYDAAWTVTATVTTVYRPSPPAPPTHEQPPILDEVVEHAIASGDEHAIKFTEVAVESHRRGNTLALPSAARAVALISAG
ncbi:MAG: questin oxidase family protein [Deltaproteobacteria bacterium]